MIIDVRLEFDSAIQSQNDKQITDTQIGNKFKAQHEIYFIHR